jgi:hydroxymethylglutaryl-CoA lyase
MAIKIIECPRDAMQGWAHPIPTLTKVNYINQLLKVGFDSLDCGSFVNPKAIPQMADTAAVLQQIDVSNTKTKLLVIVANERGAQEAMQYNHIQYIGFPFSISETFQQLNTKSSITESLLRVQHIQDLCQQYNKEMIVYISMGFGNPYGDIYNANIAIQWIDALQKMGIKIFSISDTVGIAQPLDVEYLFRNLIPAFPHLEFGAHLHTATHNWLPKIEAAFIAGCTRFDGAIGGIGGCPMAQDELIGNLDTINLVQYFNKKKMLQFDTTAFEKSIVLKNSVFV